MSTEESGQLDRPDTKTRISSVANELGQAFESLLDAIPGYPHQSRALARMLNVDKSISHRLMTAIQKGDPLATAHLIPGPEPLRRIAKAAGKQRIPDAITKRAESAIAAFESLIIEEGGDRSGLDAIISKWLPSARERFDRASKQAFYRGARQVKGIAADVFFSTALVAPSDDPMWSDAIDFLGYLGLRRVRPDAIMKLGAPMGSHHRGSAVFTIDKTPVEDPHDLLWTEYCSPKNIELATHAIPSANGWLYQMKWHDQVGPSSTRDVVLRLLKTHCARRYRPDESTTQGGSAEFVTVPTKRMIYDLILHVDVCPNSRPILRTLESNSMGPIRPNTPANELDILPLTEHTEYIGTSIDRFRIDDVPNYVEMLTTMCRTVGWNPDEFRCYRTIIDYPVFGSEIQYIYDLPAPPEHYRSYVAG